MAVPQEQAPFAPPDDSEKLFEQLETYPFSADSEFQSGFQSILSSAQSPSEIDRLTLRAKCFYLSRKLGVPIDFAAYTAWRDRRVATNNPTGSAGPQNDELSTGARITNKRPEAQSAPNSEPARESNGEPLAPYPTTFSQIVELISSGKPIPGIKEIPDTVLEGQATPPAAQKRRKPWEKGEATVIADQLSE